MATPFCDQFSVDQSFSFSVGRGLLDLFEDRPGGCARVGGTGDGAADDEQGSAVRDGLCRGGDALLILDSGS